MMRIHFIYAGGPNNNQAFAPFTITRNIHACLAARYQVIYHEWTDIGTIADLASDDIVLGHPHYDPNTVMQRVMVDPRLCRGKFLIHPFHTKRIEDNFPFDPLVKLADKIFMICGSYWIDSIGDTVFAHWKEKIVHLDMAVDTSFFTFNRQHFNSVGERRLLYVGSGMPQKNLDLMCEMMRAMPDVHLCWYGTGDHELRLLPNVTAYGWTPLNRGILDRFLSEADLFINTSISDASPTAMLEAAAIGFPIACTKQSGIYNRDGVETLSLDNVGYNVDLVRKILNEPDLMPRAVKCRTMIERFHTWDIFCDKLLFELGPYLQ